MITVIKRDNSKEPFSKDKISNAIIKAFSATIGIPDAELVIAPIVATVLSGIRHCSEIAVETIQDMVESALMEHNFKDVAKAYILYRSQRKKVREQAQGGLTAKDIVTGYVNKEDWRVQENANAGYSYASLISHVASTVIANYTLSEVYPPEIANAHKDGDMHIHDLGFGIIGYCAGWSLRDILLQGFRGVHGRAAAGPARHFDSALLQLANYLCTLQTEWAGAQAISSFDTLLAPFIRKDNLSYEEVEQCIQQFVFGLNVASRLGQCVPMTTKCLKADGTWVNGDELKIGDKIFVYDDTDHKNKIRIDTVTHITNKPFSGKLCRFTDKKRFVCDVTPDHLVLYQSLKTLPRKGTTLLCKEAAEIRKEESCVLLPVMKEDHIKDGSNFPHNYSLCEFEDVEYEGNVWCPTTETGTFIAKSENGSIFITHNCPFTNITLDWTVPEDLKDNPVILNGALDPELTYADFQHEMDVINKAFLSVMAKGDDEGRIFTFPIPTYNITKDFNWNSENAKLLFEVTGKYGLPYFQNFINSDLAPSDVRSMCCRLRIDKRELKKKTGGLFGSGEKTGSVGVVTLNMPRIGYLSKSKKELFNRIKDKMLLAKNSLEIKRKIAVDNMAAGLMPYSQIYLGGFDNHFSTIGLVGMNELCLNFLGKTIGDTEGKELAEDILKFMRDILAGFQEETGHMYNLESSPAEGTSFRLAKIDKEKYPDIITAGEEAPYYTNSTNLPVNYTADMFEALDLQENLQCLYTGGTVFHAFIGERIEEPELVAKLVRTIAYNYRIPYFTITPSFSICPVHGYIPGEHANCPYEE